VIVQLNGQKVASREEFYRELWQAPMDQDVRVTVRRAGATEAITVRPMDRYRFYRTSDK
jgi:S1-C subfamily serine protease